MRWWSGGKRKLWEAEKGGGRGREKGKKKAKQNHANSSNRKKFI
jgi:hypothetical protein